jgi:hypothetical protein
MTIKALSKRHIVAADIHGDGLYRSSRKHEWTSLSVAVHATTGDGFVATAVSCTDGDNFEMDDETADILSDAKVMNAIRIHEVRKRHGVVETLSTEEVRKNLGL